MTETIKVKNWHEKPEIPEDVNLGIQEYKDGYWITRWDNITKEPKNARLTNWTGKVEAIIIRNEDERDRKIKIKHDNYTVTAFMDGMVLTSVARFREFLLNSCDTTCLFHGTDNDLQALVEFWGKQTEPVIVKETECVGEIEEGFIAENVFVGHGGEIKELSNGYLQVSEKRSIKIAEISNQAGARSEIPVFPLNEPSGGIVKFKARVFDMMIKNRNLKVAVAIGWLKATLWSNQFFKQHKWFPLLMIHGKMASGKTIFSNWMMSMVGMRNVSPISLRTGGTTSVGLERRLAYYSSLPVWTDDYRNSEEEGQRFHTFFRNVFNRVSASKGIKNDERKIRQVIVRGCLLVDGETSPTDAALNSRMIAFELTTAERVEKHFHDLVKLEPDFNYIGFDWIKRRSADYPAFLEKFKELEKVLRKDIESPRQAQIWAVAIAGALTEPYFKAHEEKLIQYVVRLANNEIKEQKTEETIGTLWEATDILKLEQEVLYYDLSQKQIKIHLPSLLAEISGNQLTRKYKIPNVREVAKLLKQEPYAVGNDLCRVGIKVARRWILDFEHPKLPETLKNRFNDSFEDATKNGGLEDL